MRCPHRLIAVLCGGIVLSVLSVPVAVAQPFEQQVKLRVRLEGKRRSGSPQSATAPTATQPETAAKTLEDILEKRDRVSQELVRQGRQKEHVPAEQQKSLLFVPDAMGMGTVWDGRAPQGQRVFAAQLKIANLTAKNLTLKREDIGLTADEQTYHVGELSQQVRNNGIQVGNQHHNLGSLSTPETLPIPAGGTATTWVVFAGLPQTADTPDFHLTIRAGDETAELDINEFARGLSQISVEHIGPRQSLGLITIGGKLDSVSAGALVEALDELTQSKIARVVIQWSEKAEPVDPNVMNWLQHSADRAGRAQFPDGQNFQLPTVPVSIRELHLSQLPQGTNNQYGGTAAARIHKTTVEAAAAALASAFETLSAEELLAEIETGHPLIRPAALASAGRLQAEHLPLILRYVDEKDDAMRRAAIEALGQFGERAAVEKLVEIVRHGEQPWTMTAIESLAGSRFAAARRALYDWLRENPPRVTGEVVGILARHPDPLWADVIYEFARQPDSPLGTGALRAMMVIGHPHLTDLLERALREGDDQIQREVFQMLSAREDDRSQQLAADYAVARIREGDGSDGTILQFLNRTRDPRVLEPLLEQLRTTDEKQQNNRSAVISTLSQIGDQRVADVLIEIYPKLKTHEKATALNTLQQLRSPKFRQLAIEALKTGDSGLLSTAAQTLVNEGSEEGIVKLIEAFETTKEDQAWNYIANALSSVGTPEARDALRKARDSSDANKRQFAINALQNMRHRSPAFQYVYQGMDSIRQGELARATKQFAFAIKLDPDLADAHAYYGSLLLNEGKREEARKSFEKAVQLDPYSAHAIAGLATMTVLDGKYEEGIRAIEQAREKFKNFEQLPFKLRAAGVYAHAMQHVRKDENVADRDKKAAEYKTKAIEQLEQFMQQNQDDRELIRNDPDLKALAETPEFKQLFGEDPAAAAPVGALVPLNGVRAIAVPVFNQQVEVQDVLIE